MTLTSKVLLCFGGVLAAAAGVGLSYPRAVELFFRGDVRELEPEGGAASDAPSPLGRVLVIAIDGVGRSLLYDMLRAGELPELARLLGGGSGASFPHACFSERVLTVLPSTTIAAWTTAFTGAPPGVHGVTGNELFLRHERELFAPAPVSIHDVAPALAVYTDDAIGRRLEVPTVYEQMRARDPKVKVWVAMSQVHRGADRLVVAKRSVFASAFDAYLREAVAGVGERRAYAELDEEVIDSLADAIEDSDAPPDVLTLYVSGTDLYAHKAESGPDPARRGYLREVLDPALAKLAAALARRGFLDDVRTVVLSDHGHTDVVHDDRHALSTEGADEPPEVLRRAGYRVRPFEWKVDDDDDFQAVLAYNGAIAFVYAADRSTCPEPGQRCDWARPPRFREDVEPAAEAFLRASRDGATVPELRGALDMVLVRTSGGAEPFAVYEGDGSVVPVERYLEEHRHPNYVSLAPRLRALGSGPHGDRAGDLLLIAHNGDAEGPDGRFYFATQYRSWHGSPSRRDSEIPLVVAHAARSTRELCRVVDDVLGADPSIARVTPLLLRLRER